MENKLDQTPRKILDMRGASMATAMDEDYEKEEIQRILNSYRTLSKTKVFDGSSNKKKLKR
jgi:hypothetical protein